MIKHQNIFFIPLLFLCGALLSCQSTKTPLQLSEHFWLGIQTSNMALVKKYSLTNSIDESVDLELFENISDVTFGRIIIDGDLAEIETQVAILLNEKIMDISLNTYLENNNNVWKVNFSKTVFQLTEKQNEGEALANIEQMTEKITEDIKESVEEIKEKVVPEIKSKIEHKVEQAEKELLKKLPELKNIFDEFLQELEKSLEELIPPEEEPKTQET